MQMKIELIIVPVSDVERAKAFYTEKIGFHADHDHVVSEDIRFVQLTPPGSACSIAIGKGLTEKKPGSLSAILMVVEDIKAAREELLKRGVEISEIDVQPWADFAYFRDPDGNSWSLQELPKRA
ncbi:glyoxalase [Ktedonosporobacter rubrisoli]|uniref:Glyoxalase n=1 Tax=Ktedonosporobacter rubrisoli TaxID=2509675 RepID=A0A4P6K722_KTERU|nr:glyoxalase [Ktedonosporobacter rubrisoli]